MDGGKADSYVEAAPEATEARSLWPNIGIAAQCGVIAS